MSLNSKASPRVAIFLATGYEMGEAIIIIDLLRRAQINVDIVSITSELLVKSSHNVNIMCEKLITKINFADYQMLILPGGNDGVSNLQQNKLLNQQLVTFAHEQNKFVAAICAAPQILGMSGLVNSKKVTHYPNANKGLEKSIIVNEKVVVDNNVITGRSIGAAFAFALEIITCLISKAKSAAIAEQLVF